MILITDVAMYMYLLNMTDNDCLEKTPFLTLSFLLLFLITINPTMQMQITHNPSVLPITEANTIADFAVSSLSWSFKVGWLVRVGWTLLIVAKSTWQVDSVTVSVTLSTVRGSSNSRSNIPACVA